jgi:hypothetical protein
MQHIANGSRDRTGGNTSLRLAASRVSSSRTGPLNTRRPLLHSRIHSRLILRNEGSCASRTLDHENRWVDAAECDSNRICETNSTTPRGNKPGLRSWRIPGACRVVLPAATPYAALATPGHDLAAPRALSSRFTSGRPQGNYTVATPGGCWRPRKRFCRTNSPSWPCPSTRSIRVHAHPFAATPLPGRSAGPLHPNSRGTLSRKHSISSVKAGRATQRSQRRGSGLSQCSFSLFLLASIRPGFERPQRWQ